MRSSRRRVVLPSAALLAILLVPGCKWGIPDYTLNVVLGEGVSGTPEAGQYSYEELSIVEFSYAGIEPLHTVEVILNDRIRKTASGSFVIYDDGYELEARLVDVRGEWDITLDYDDATADLEFTIEIAGTNLLSGAFTDSRGYNGTWTAESNVLVLAYWDWEFYILNGTVFGFGNETGAFSGGGKTGTWTAQKPE